LLFPLARLLPFMLVNTSNGGSMLVLVLATLIAGQPVSRNQPDFNANRARDRQVLTLLSRDIQEEKATLRSDEVALSAAYGLLGHDVRGGALLEAADDAARVNDLEWKIVQDLGSLSADRQLVRDDRRDLAAEQSHTAVVTPAGLLTGAV
jgi:hypothetical protein